MAFGLRFGLTETNCEQPVQFFIDVTLLST